MNFKMSYYVSACSNYCTLIIPIPRLILKHSYTVLMVRNVILTIVIVTRGDQSNLFASILLHRAVLLWVEKYINESVLNQTLLDINKDITDDILEVNMTCHQDFYQYRGSV